MTGRDSFIPIGVRLFVLRKPVVEGRQEKHCGLCDMENEPRFGQNLEF